MLNSCITEEGKCQKGSRLAGGQAPGLGMVTQASDGGTAPGIPPLAAPV